MIEHRLRVSVVPWDDRRFLQLLDAACALIAKEHIALESRAAADLAQQMLRAAGYRDAVIEYHRTVNDVLHATRAGWTVRRDGGAAH